MATTTLSVPAVVRRPSRETLIALGLTAALLAVGIAAAHPFLDAAPYLPSPELSWWALAILFAAAESSVMYVQEKREAQTTSLSEVPLTLGLFLAGPLALLVGRVVGLAILTAVKRRTPPLKTTFNLALMVGETGVAVAVFAGVTSVTDGLGLVSWAAALAAAFAGNVLGGIAITSVIAAYDGGTGLRGMLLSSARGQVTTPVGVIIGLIGVTSLTQSLQSLWLLLGLGVLVLLGYRAYGGLLDRHLNLERLYGSAARWRHPLELDGSCARARRGTGRAARRRATAAFVGPDGELVARVRLDARRR